MVSGYQNGTIAQLLQAIIGQINFDGEPISNIGNILLSILEQTPYDDEPKSVLAELFLKLKDKLEGRAFTPYDKEPTSVIAEILLSILNETEYDKEPNSRIAELLLELKAELESYAEITTSGAVANFTTSVVKPLVNLKAYFEATQEAGTPTPQSPKAISGVSAVSVYQSGANLWDEEWEVGMYSTSTGAKESASTVIRCKNPIAVKGGNNYYFKNSGMGVAFQIYKYDSKMNYLGYISYGSGVKNLESGVAFITFNLNATYGTTYNNNLSINLSTDTDYHAYNPNSNVTLINLGGTYYGGYVEQDKDGKRELVVTWGSVVLSTLDWNYNTSNNCWRIDDFTAIKTPVDASPASALSEQFPVIKAQGYTTSHEHNTLAINANKSIFCDNNSTENEPEGLMIYELAEPFTVALPDGEPIIAFNGVNNVWSDSGDTSVTYLAKIEDNLRSTAKFRANLKTEKQKLKEQKELKELEEKETIKEPIKEIGDTKK